MSSDRRPGRRAAARTLEHLQQEEQKTHLAHGIPVLEGGGGIFKSAAVAVLRRERRLLPTGEITRLALEYGFITCQGKTPEATMASAMYTDIRRKMDKSVFTRPQEGLFGLREWIEEGFFPNGMSDPTDTTAIAPFKPRNSHKSRGSGSRRGRRNWRDKSSASADEEEEQQLGDDMDVDALDVDGEADGDDDEGGGYGRGLRTRNRGRGGMSAGRGGRGIGSAAAAATGGRGSGGGGKMRAAAPYKRRLSPDDDFDDDDDEEEEVVPAIKKPTRSGRIPRLSGAALGAGVGGGLPKPPESPLEVLAAAGSKEAEREERSSGRRRRPTGIVVPNGGHSPNLVSPKSPLEDGLAALHEIATSPGGYANASLVDIMGGGQQGGHGGKRGRGSGNKVIIDLGNLHYDGAGGGVPYTNTSGGTPSSSLLRELDTPHMPGDAGGALPHGAGTHHHHHAGAGHHHPGGRSSLMVNIPSLHSPYGYQTADLNTPALLALPLPDVLPHGGSHDGLGGSLPGATPNSNLVGHHHHYGGLGSPRLLAASGLRPGARGAAGAGATTHDLLQVHGTSIYSSQQALRGPESPAVAQAAAAAARASAGFRDGAAPTRQQQQAATAAAVAKALQASPGQANPSTTMSPGSDNGGGDDALDDLSRVHQLAERMEARLGSGHPQVGKAWLALARMYQHVGQGQAEKSRYALLRAYQAAKACADLCGVNLAAKPHFKYLITERSKQQQAAAATAAAAVAAAQQQPQEEEEEGGATAAAVTVAPAAAAAPPMAEAAA